MYLYDCTLFSILLPTSFLLCIPLPYPIWSFSIICCYRVIYYRILLFWSHSYLIWSYLYVELAVFLQNCKTIYLSIWLFLLWLRMQRLFELFRRPTVILPFLLSNWELQWLQWLQWLQHSCDKRKNFVLPGFASMRQWHRLTQAPVGNPFLPGNHHFPKFHALSRTEVSILRCQDVSRCLKCTLSGLFAVKMLLRKVSWLVLVCFKVLCFWSRNGWFHPVQAEAKWWPGRSIGKLS
jgi:hypothetical protein